MTWLRGSFLFFAVFALLSALIWLRHGLSARLVPKSDKPEEVDWAVTMSLIFAVLSTFLAFQVPVESYWGAVGVCLLGIVMGTCAVVFHSVCDERGGIGWIVSWSRVNFRNDLTEVRIRPYHNYHFVAGFRQRNLSARSDETSWRILAFVEFCALPDTPMAEFDPPGDKGLVKQAEKAVERQLREVAKTIHHSSLADMERDEAVRQTLASALGNLSVDGVGVKLRSVSAKYEPRIPPDAVKIV